MKVLLVQSATGRRELPVFPLGLAFIAGQLREHEVRVLDLSLGDGSTLPLSREVESFEPDVIGISLRNIDDSSWPDTHSYIPPFTAAVESLESWKGILVVGGTGFSIYTEKILELHPRIDFGLPGEAEVLFPLFLDHLDRGTGIDGWEGGRILPSIRADLSLIELPDYSILDLAPYAVEHGIGVQSRRGCPFGCTYCTYGFLSGAGFRERPVSHVISDIENIAGLGVTSFQFVDSVFNSPSGYMSTLLEELESAGTGLYWAAWLDTDVNTGQLEAMVAAGAGKIDFSPDAISAKGLRKLGKKGDPGALLPLVRAARRTGLRVGVNFFNGNPGEGFFSLLRKLAFMVRARLTFGPHETFVNIGTIRVYAHSRIAEQMLREGSVPPGCDFFEPVFYLHRGPSDWLFRLYGMLRKVKHG